MNVKVFHIVNKVINILLHRGLLLMMLFMVVIVDTKGQLEEFRHLLGFYIISIVLMTCLVWLLTIFWKEDLELAKADAMRKQKIREEEELI